MEFPASRIISAKSLSQMIKEAAESGQRFCFILGSGASVESGIPSGGSLEMQWMDCLMGRMEDRGMPPMDAGETRRIAEALHGEQALDHPFQEIENAWLRAKEAGRPVPSEYYFDIYRLRFHANSHQGYRYLEKIMERCAPSLGYHTLAKLLTENNLHNLVITTNFDSLVEDALFLYTDKRPLVVSHESLADYIEANIQRPIVAKVHRGLMYAPFNSPDTTKELKPEWERALRQAFSTYTPIVIGYAGGDHSLMSFLEQDSTAMPNGVYWCYRGKCEPSCLPGENIQAFVKKRGGCFVATGGFDALMVEIGKTLYGDDIRPGLTEKKLKKVLDDRVQTYNDQWNRLNEQPEMEEALRTMNAAEQQEEERRERQASLTAQDRFRRGFRAAKEGRLQEAVEEYTEAIRMNPGYASAYNNRGNLYRELNEYQKALDDYNKAIELDPEDPNAYFTRGLLYHKLNECQEALEDFNQALELGPDHPDCYYSRGSLYYKLNEHQKALEDFSKAIERNPDDPDCYYSRGLLYHELNEYQKALEDYNKALELDPGYASAYYNRGLLYEALGELEKAIEDYTRTLERNPKHKKACQKRGEAYAALGQEALAEADRKSAAAL